MDKYKENERLKQEYRDQNPGGYPGMPQNLKERMRRNEMGIGNQSNLGGGNLIAGYDPDFPSDDNEERLSVAIGDQMVVVLQNWVVMFLIF